jgi:nitronate monooxygenase
MYRAPCCASNSNGLVQVLVAVSSARAAALCGLHHQQHRCLSTAMDGQKRKRDEAVAGGASDPATAVMLRTRLTDPASVWKMRVPLVSAPMAGAAGGALAAAACQAGALGFIAVGHGRDTAALREQIALFRATAPPTAPLALGFIGYSSCAPDGGVLAEILAEHTPAVVQFFAPAVVDGGSNIRASKAAGALVLAQVGSVAEAREAIGVGVDGIIAQGREAGGHGLRSELGSGTLPLAAAVVNEAAHSPGKPVVLAAGGITDGRGLAAALALGCDGAILGTRLWASREAMGDGKLKAQLVAATCDDVIRTRVFDTLQNATSPTPWPEPFDSVGALKNDTTAHWHSDLEGLDAAVTLAIDGKSDVLSLFSASQAAADVSVCTVLAGEGVGLVGAVEGAEDIVRRVEAEAVSTVRGMQGILQG